MTGVLYIVATPIGNLADISQRALGVLAAVHLIAAEDTRHSKTLLQHYQINKPLMALHDHNERAQFDAIVSRLLQGENVALISDAGTPLISDPGFVLVRAARAAGVTVVPIPGPSALIAALSAAGLPSERFVFEGFLPAKSAARRQRLQALQQEQRTVIFYESSHRIVDCIADAVEIFRDRPACLAKEISKQFEAFVNGSFAEIGQWLAADVRRAKGEFVLLVQGAETTADVAEGLRVLEILLAEFPLKKACQLASKITGVSKNQLYQTALSMNIQQSD